MLWSTCRHVFRRHPRLLVRSNASSALYGWNETTNPAPEGPWRNQTTVEWPPFDDVDAWLQYTDLDAIQESFESQGYAIVPQIVPETHLQMYKDMHDQMVSGEIDASNHRHDLGGHKDQQVNGKENVGQIMWPTDHVRGGRDGPLHQRGYAVARALMGIETAFDFDMLIYKEPHSAT